MLLVIGLLLFLFWLADSAFEITDNLAIRITEILICIILLIISLSGSIFLPEKLLYRKEIVSLDLTNGVTGRFYLRSGRIKNKPIYYYYAKDGDGFRLEQVSGDVLIRQHENEYYVECYGYPGNFWIPKSDHRRYIISIPENSIMQSYNPNIK